MRRLAGVLGMLGWASWLGAVEINPLVNFSVMGGQTFFAGTASNLGLNGNLAVTPVMQGEGRWSFFPTYMAGYQGTRSVKELAGGGTLFQDSAVQGVWLKGVYRGGARWKLKPSIGTRWEWLREVKGETWGQGLFDNRAYAGGVEAEYTHSPKTGARGSVDYFELTFPNYSSLESQTDPTFSREYAGARTLNSHNGLAMAEWWMPTWADGRLNVKAVVHQRWYGDQPVLNAEGQPTTTDRRDIAYTFDAGEDIPIEGVLGLKGVARLGGSYRVFQSNQNHYDSQQVFQPFQRDYYGCQEWSVEPELSFLLGDRPWNLNLSLNYERRVYAHRPSQNAAGVNQNETLKSRTVTPRFLLSLPLGEHLQFKWAADLSWGHSNTDYQQVYRYNYKIASFLMGVSYDY